MGNASQGQVKDEKATGHHLQEEFAHFGQGLGKLYGPGLKIIREKATCCHNCWKFLYVVIALIVCLLSIAVIFVTVSTAFATKMFSSEQSGRLVALIVLAVTAGVSLSMSIYAIVAVFKRQAKALHAAGVVLIILALIQAVIAGVSIKVTAEDEVALSRSLAESFNLARDDNPRHVKLWATTQKDLTCCGVYSSDDYRSPNLPAYFPPDVPISCCPSYDPSRSALVQERDREICKARKTFYDMGCKDIIIDAFRQTSTVVLSVTIALICHEVIMSIIGSCLSKDDDLKVMVVTPEDGTVDPKKDKTVDPKKDAKSGGTVVPPSK